MRTAAPKTLLGNYMALVFPSFDTLSERSPTVPPLVVGWALSLLAMAWTGPIVAAAFSGSELDVVKGFQKWLWIGALFAPALILAKTAVLSAVVWALLTLVGADTRFRRILSYTLYGEGILLVHAVALAAFLNYVQTVQSPVDLASPFTLSAFFSETGIVLQTLAQAISVFHILWIVFMWGCFRKAEHLTRLSSAFAVFCMVGCILGAALVRGLFLR